MDPSSERVSTSAPRALRYGPRSPLLSDSSEALAADAAPTIDEAPASNGPPALRGNALVRELLRMTRV
jgi:hypothetical protein